MRRTYYCPKTIVVEMEGEGMLATSTDEPLEEPTILDVNTKEQVLDGLSLGEWGASDIWEDE
ncbi:MAG: hypothetical protein NC388_08210 [Clostridium sp.]|nr:hypothetical protein [Clostridium sp.]